jgi:AraC-like DNA-binding protein
MSYVSLENAEPFLKCFEVIAADKSSTVTDSVLYLSGKAGKGFLTVAGIPNGIEVMAVNVSMLTDDLTFRFLPSQSDSSFIFSFDQIGPQSPGTGEPDLSYIHTGMSANRIGSSVSVSDGEFGKVLVYPREREIRSLILRVQKSSLGSLVRDTDASLISSIVGPGKGNSSVSWPITYKYRLLIDDFIAAIVDHPFRELFAARNISMLIECLLQQYFVMTELNKDGNCLSAQDMLSLCRVEDRLCAHYKLEFPGIEKLSRISAMSPTSLKTKFKKFYGETLFGYYQQNKMEHARKLLDSKVPVKVVATEIGYSNPSHFTLAFKKEYGFSPWHYLNPH